MKILTVLMFLGAMSLICSQEDYFSPEPFLDESQVVDMVEEEVEEEEILGTPVQRLAYSVSEFGYDLYRLMASKDPSANVFLSPLSVAAGLSALSLGATSTNKDILQRILNYNSLQDLDVHSAFKDLLTEISMQPKQFKTVSRIYAKKRLKVQQAFVNQVAQYYGSRPKLIANNMQRELSNMNQWLKIQTGGKISQGVRSLPARLSLLLLSAAHYQGKLVTKFNAANTMEKSFQLEYGQEVNVPTMSSQHYPLRYGYDSELNCKIGLFRYMGDISLLIFLPSGLGQNMSAIEESLTPVFVHDLVSQLHLAKASVSLPKLKLTTELELMEVLGEMNLKPLYSATQLGKLSNSPASISSVTHVASLTLAEGGQEEAAPPLPNSPQFSLHFLVNRPFLMLLYDNPSGSLLHIARVMDPRTLGQGRQ